MRARARRRRPTPDDVPDSLTTPAVAVARQPICDAAGRVRGYELLFRDAGGAAATDDGERATARVLTAACLEIGLPDLVGAHPAYVNVTGRFLLETDPLPVAAEDVVLELLETERPEPELVERLRELVAAGYALALDDFTYGPEWDPVLEVASVVKIDVRTGFEAAARTAQAVSRFDVVLLAEKVEDHDEFDRARELGFELFQGWYFCRPTLVTAQEIPGGSVAAIRAVADLARPDVTFEELEEIVSHDPGLTLRLLKLLNSAAFATARRIDTVRDALMLIGARAVRQWAMLVALAGVRTSCDELVPTALSRARALHGLAAERGDDVERAFAVGLFSVADALLGRPLEDVLAGIPLSEQVVGALLERTGPDGEALDAIIRHERGEAAWPPGVQPAAFASIYADALAWSHATAGRVAA